MITVTFCISLRINFLSVFFERIINSLDFTPNKMDIYYNEFSTPKFFIKYNPKLLQLLSLAEVDGGITSFNLYDNKYSNENVTPFFRAKILDTTFSNNQVICILEWVSYSTLYFNPDIHFLNKMFYGSMLGVSTTGVGTIIAEVWFIAGYGTMGINYIFTGEAKGISDMIDESIGTYELYEGIY